jgi:hypothetical protein
MLKMLEQPACAVLDLAMLAACLAKAWFDYPEVDVP